MPNSDLPEIHRAVPILDKVILFSLFMFAVFSMFSISITQISFALGALAWLLKVHLTQTWKEMEGTLVGAAILCFCLACILAVTASVDLESSFKHLKKLLQFVIFFWVANTVQDEKQRDLLIGLVIVAGVVMALNGLVEAWGSSSYRITGTRSVPSTFGGILMIAGLVTLGRLLFHKPMEYWVLGSTGTIGLCLLLSLTRQAWLGFFMGGIFLIFLWNKKYLLLIPLLLVGFLLYSPPNIEYSPRTLQYRILSFTNLQDGPLQQRVSTWKGGWKIFKDHPLTGCGFKCVDSIHSQYPDPSGLIARFRGMHNNILQLMVDTGVVGLGTWLSIWAAYFIEIFRRWKDLPEETSQGNTKAILMGSSAAVIGFLVGGFFETNIYDSEVTMLLYFLMGLSLAKVEKVTKVD